MCAGALRTGGVTGRAPQIVSHGSTPRRQGSTPRRQGDAVRRQGFAVRWKQNPCVGARRGRGRERVRSAGHWRRDERGAGTVLALMVVLTTCAALLVAVWLVGWIGCLRQARSAADLAALAGAQAYTAGQDPCPAARAAGARNQVTVGSCRLEGHPDSFLVRVQVRAQLKPAWGGAARTVEARAVAGSLRTG
ncbi:Rv3654c family TadE-like protein [Luteococcus peritonei]|uniref:Rv3654c family TadE-like protein n=1 Tax=Luteococcus peritonei TaxID=88874 RepID=A0ABW4RVG5_9ACTN